MVQNTLLSLLQLTDPTLPIGGFAHSAALETYVQNGAVHNSATAAHFVRNMLTENLQFTDGAFVSLAWDAARQNDNVKLLRLDQECTALKLPREMREASQKLGLRLLKIVAAFDHLPAVDAYKSSIQQGDAVGHLFDRFWWCAACLQIKKADALFGFYYTTAAGMVTNCVKLIPLGQVDGQQLLFSLQATISQMVTGSLQPDPDLIGVCCAGFDIRSMQHEQLYSRLYMS